MVGKMQTAVVATACSILLLLLIRQEIAAPLYTLVRGSLPAIIMQTIYRQLFQYNNIVAKIVIRK
jgi:hypothetical protein